MLDAGGVNARRPLPYYLVSGSFAISRAEEHGITRGRLRASDLDIPFRGVRSAGLDLDDLVQRCRAAETFMDEREAFSHSTALGLWGAPLPSDLQTADAVLHIGTRDSTRRRRKGVVGHRLPPDTSTRLSPDGLITLAPATAWCQFASQQGERSDDVMLLALVAVADFLVTGQRIRGIRGTPACTVKELDAAVDRHGAGRGARLLSRALPLVRIGVDSPKETELRLILREAGLGEPSIGHVIQTRLGPLEPDLAYPDRRVLLEYEGDTHRRDQRRWRGDFERVRAFQQAGWVVIRVNADDLSDPVRRGALIAHLRALLT